MASRSPIRTPSAPRNAVAGFACSASTLTVGYRVVMSKTPFSRMATTDGPEADGSQTRPTSAPASPSSGNMAAAFNDIIENSPVWRPRHDNPHQTSSVLNGPSATQSARPLVQVRAGRRAYAGGSGLVDDARRRT